jgi:hypothetical protein
MSFEEQASSWALSLFDVLDSHTHKNVRILAAVGGTLVTIIMWIVHLTFPAIFYSFLQTDNWEKLILGFILAPPFVGAFATGTFIYPQAIEPKKKDESGPMSTYFYQERSSRRWKLLIIAGIIAAVNFMLMLVTSGM